MGRAQRVQLEHATQRPAAAEVAPPPVDDSVDSPEFHLLVELEAVMSEKEGESYPSVSCEQLAFQAFFVHRVEYCEISYHQPLLHPVSSLVPLFECVRSKNDTFNTKPWSQFGIVVSSHILGALLLVFVSFSIDLCPSRFLLISFHFLRLCFAYIGTSPST